MPFLVDQLYPYLFLRSEGAAFIEIIANEDDVAVGVKDAPAGLILEKDLPDIAEFDSIIAVVAGGRRNSS
jgi:hypothetical protein